MGEGIVRELRIDMCALLYLKWITHKTYCRAQEFCSVLCGSLDERGVWGKSGYTYICVAESLCRPPETITLLISYILI